MAQYNEDKGLSYSYTVKLNLGNLYSVVQQINTKCNEVESENVKFNTQVSALGTAFHAFDEAYKQMIKDFTSDDLKAADKKVDQLAITVHQLLLALTHLPEAETARRTAERGVQIFKELQFSTKDSYGAGASKLINISQELEKMKTDLEQLGIWQWVQKMVAQAYKVQTLLEKRTETISAREKGKVAATRTEVEECLKRLFHTIEAMYQLEPTEAIVKLCNQLVAIEEYAKQYYLRSKPNSADPEPEPTPVDPEIPDDPDDSDDDQKDK